MHLVIGKSKIGRLLRFLCNIGFYVLPPIGEFTLFFDAIIYHGAIFHFSA